MSRLAEKPTVTTNMSGFIPSTIKPENIAKIMRMSSVGQYSQAREAVLRELVANAMDSHRLAGLELETNPVTVILPTLLNPTLQIIDHGVGLNLEEVTEIFGNFGGSSKEGIDNVAGVLGIGAKSTYAIASQYEVVAVKDGIRITMLFAMSETGAPGYYIINQEKTSRPNGVTIRVPVDSENLHQWSDIAYRILRWYPKDQIDLKNYEEKYAQEKTSHAGSAAFPFDESVQINTRLSTENVIINKESDLGGLRPSSNYEHLVIMDNLPYQLPSTLVDRLGYNMLSYIKYIKVATKSLIVTPSREQILDEDENYRVLHDHIEAWRNHISKVVLPEGQDGLSELAICKLRHKLSSHLASVLRLRHQRVYTINLANPVITSLRQDRTVKNEGATLKIEIETLRIASETGGILVLEPGVLSNNALTERLRLYTRDLQENNPHREAAVIVVDEGFDLEELYYESINNGNDDVRMIWPEEIEVITTAQFIAITNPLRPKRSRSNETKSTVTTVYAHIGDYRSADRIGITKIKDLVNDGYTIVLHENANTMPYRTSEPYTINGRKKDVHISAEGRGIDKLIKRLDAEGLTGVLIEDHLFNIFTADQNKQIVANAIWFQEHLDLTTRLYIFNKSHLKMTENPEIEALIGDLLDPTLHSLLYTWTFGMTQGYSARLYANRAIKRLGKLPKPTIDHLGRTLTLIGYHNAANANGCAPLPDDMVIIMAKADIKDRPKRRRIKKAAATTPNAKEAS